jgi:hypothetical protein
LAPTRFQAGYAFTAQVLPGDYAVTVDGAVGGDGMAALSTASSGFTVDFGAGVSLDPPLPPAVSASSNGSLSHLAASWPPGSANVDQYRYAVGTAPNARNVVGWTYLTATSFTRNDLQLVAGQRYYVTVQARNTSGLWSVDSVSSTVVAGVDSTVRSLFLPTVQR